jgi:hypothetical protein
MNSKIIVSESSASNLTCETFTGTKLLPSNVVKRTKHTLYVGHIFRISCVLRELHKVKLRYISGPGIEQWPSELIRHCTWRTVQLLFSLYKCCVHGTTVVFTVKLLCSRYNCCVHGTTVVFTVQLLCSLYNCCVHGTTVVFTVQLLYSRYNWCVHFTTVVFTVQPLCSLYNRCVHGTTVVFTV